MRLLAWRGDLTARELLQFAHKACKLTVTICQRFMWNTLLTTIGVRKPSECQTKEEVREELDRIDRELVGLFAQRHGYVTRMAELKNDPHEAFVPARIEAIIAKVRQRALELGGDDDQAELIWRTLIDWNINYEKGVIAARRKG